MVWPACLLAPAACNWRTDGTTHPTAYTDVVECLGAWEGFKERHTPDGGNRDETARQERIASAEVKAGPGVRERDGHEDCSA